MLFVTNRFPEEGISTVPGRKFTFDLDNNAPSNSVFYCVREKIGGYKELASKEFMKKIRDTKCRQILIYVHGFSNLPDMIFDRAIQLQKLCDSKKKSEILVVPLIWPCDNNLGVVKDYWDDQKSADMSSDAFGRVFQKFNKWRNDNKQNPKDKLCMKRINLLAHSMGARVLRGALGSWNKDLTSGVPMIFRNIFLVAADMVNETLHRREAGELICHAARNVTVYYASDDLALRASKVANLRNNIASRRLGHTGPERWKKTPNNVYAVDCDDVNTIYDLPLGHSYFLSGRDRSQPGIVFDHIFDCLESGRVTQSSRNIILR